MENLKTIVEKLYFTKSMDIEAHISHFNFSTDLTMIPKKFLLKINK